MVYYIYGCPLTIYMCANHLVSGYVVVPCVTHIVE